MRIGNYKANSGSFKPGGTPWNKGKKTPKNVCEKLRKAKLKNPVKYWLNKQRPEMRKEIKSGWQKFRKQIRERTEYKEWRRQVFIRDNWTCQKCNTRSGKGKIVILEAHHLKPVVKYPDLIFEISNGQTLCLKCHKKINHNNL